MSVSLTRFAAPAAWTSRGVAATLDHAGFRGVLDQPELWPGGATGDAEKRLRGWSFARLIDDTRVLAADEAAADSGTTSRVLGISGLCVEYVDEPNVDAKRIAQWWGGRAYVAYTTAFHGLPKGDKPEGPRWRVMVPFNREATLSEAIELAKWTRHPRRQCGIVDADTERVWRVVAEPSMNTGGYSSSHGDGELLDVTAALREYASWRTIDRFHDAEECLGDGTMSKAVGRFARHLRAHVASFRWSREEGAFSRLAGIGAELWPGRVAVLTGLPGAGRTAFAVQVAEANAWAGRPVLLCGLRTGTDEFLTRMLAQRGSEHDTGHAITLGGPPPADVGTHLQAMVRELRTLAFFTPSASERSAKELAARVRATSERVGGAPPLLVIDALEGWDSTDDLGSMLFDIARPGGLGSAWPGAGVLAVYASERGQQALTSCAGLQGADEATATALVPNDPVGRESSLVFALASDPRPPDQARPALLRVLRNGQGGTTSLKLQFVPGRGLFTADTRG